ncbi:MAG: Dabb family protein [Lachnospiraceae bacterium]|nr:Dabb family protein [Lachnospiraceae bacterium]
MIRHICMFKLQEENKAANLAKAQELADELLKPIPQIKRYEVVVNSEKAPDSNYELSLIFDYDSMEALKEYSVHPNHIKFGDFIKSVRESRACIDYEF